MTIQHINIGSVPNDGTGDTLRTAGQKFNENWDYIESIIPPTQVIVYTPVSGGLVENLIYSDASSVQQNIVLPVADGSAQKTVIYKIDDSVNVVHITTTGTFKSGVASYDLTGEGESIIFDPNVGDGLWYVRR